MGDSLDAVDALIRKQDDFAKSFAAQEDKIKDLNETATKLIGNEHYASDDIEKRKNDVNNRRANIQEKSDKRREILEESRKLQQFEKEADETKAWINEKLMIATDESYKV